MGLELTLPDCAWAQPQAGAPQPSFGELLGRMLPMFIVVFLIFYFLVMRPQAQKLRTQNDMLNALKRGDQVLTTSGMFAKVAGVEKDYILLEVANNVRIKFDKAHIAKRIDNKEAEKAAA